GTRIARGTGTRPEVNAGSEWASTTRGEGIAMDHEGRGVSSLPITRRRVLFLVGAGATAALAGLSWRTARGRANTVRLGPVTGNFSNPAVKQMVDAMQSELRKYPNAKFFVQDSANVSEQVAKAETMLGQ